jgi:hypothetical protein
MTREQEISEVKRLGIQMGYGHVMSLASALWRKELKEKGYPISGAFVPTCLPFINEEIAEEDEPTRSLYDRLVEKA